MLSLEQTIDSAWERRAELTSAEIDSAIKPAIERSLSLLESGELRVAEPDGAGSWRVNQWLKKAVLLSFRVGGNRVMDAAPAPYYDKVPLRFEGFDEAAFKALGARAVPGAVVRRGAQVVEHTELDRLRRTRLRARRRHADMEAVVAERAFM